MELCLRPKRKICFYILSIAILTCGLLVKVFTETHNVCQPSDEKCYFKKYGHLELPMIDPVKVGHVRPVQLSPTAEGTMVTLAMRPPLLEIPNFLSSEECDHLISLAKEEGLVVSKTIDDGLESDLRSLGEDTLDIFNHFDFNQDALLDPGEILKYLETSLDFNGDPQHILQMYLEVNLDQDGDASIDFEEFRARNITAMALFIRKVKEAAPETKSRHSDQAWINTDSRPDDKVLNNIQQRIQSITKLPLEMIRSSEPIQVVSYGTNGHYNCHLDSEIPVADKMCCHLLEAGTDNCRICRYLTVLYFLNDVDEGGETAFPLADNSTFNEEIWIRDEANVCNLAKNCYKSNIVVRPEKGKAVLWYNHIVDNRTKWLGALDHFTFHGGCDVRRGTKWIANSWISVGNDRIKDIWNWVTLAHEQEKNAKEKEKLAQKLMRRAIPYDEF